MPIARRQRDVIWQQRKYTTRKGGTTHPSRKEAKVSTAKALWVPAVNNAGTWGRWGFIEIRDP
jgi:hypothetical protein